MGKLLSNFMEIIDSDIFEDWAKDILNACDNMYNETSIYFGIRAKNHNLYFIISQYEFSNTLFKFELSKYITLDDWKDVRKICINDINECYKILREKLKSFDLVLYQDNFTLNLNDINLKSCPYRIDVIHGISD